MFGRKPPKEPGADHPFRREIKEEKKRMRKPRHRALCKVVTSILSSL